MKIISKCKIISPQFLIGDDFMMGPDNICQLDFLPHYQILLSGKYWTMRWIKTASSKNSSFADLDRLKLAGEVFAYLAVPAYSVGKSRAGADSTQAWLRLPQRASDAGDLGERTGRASWASAPPPDLPGLRLWPPRQTCCLAGSWAGSEAGERPAEGFPGGPQTASPG